MFFLKIRNIFLLFFINFFSFNLYSARGSIIALLGSNDSGLKNLATNLVAGVRLFRSNLDEKLDNEVAQITASANYNSASPYSIPSENSVFTPISSESLVEDELDCLNKNDENFFDASGDLIDMQDDKKFYDCNSALYDLFFFRSYEQLKEYVKKELEKGRINLCDLKYRPVVSFLLANHNCAFSFKSDFNNYLSYQDLNLVHCLECSAVIHTSRNITKGYFVSRFPRELHKPEKIVRFNI